MQPGCSGAAWTHSVAAWVQCRSLDAAGCVIGLRQLLSTQRAYHAAVSPGLLDAAALSVGGLTTARSGAAVQLCHQGC